MTAPVAAQARHSNVHVTAHAIDRYIERVAPVGRQQAERAMMSAERAIAFSAAIGGHVVRLSSGARLIIVGGHRAGLAGRRRDQPETIRVVTVLAKGAIQGGEYPRSLHTACCAACGVHCTSPLTRACARADCALLRDDQS